jgi:hypothetical protein
MTTMVKKMMNKEKQQQQLQTNSNHNDRYVDYA